MSAPGTPPEALAQARQVLARGGAHSNRIACWLARSALEVTVDALLARQGFQLAEASMRSKLTVLHVAYEHTEIPRRAAYAWHGLSTVCHRHAFELAPTASEAAHYVEVVARLSLPEEVPSAQPG